MGTGQRVLTSFIGSWESGREMSWPLPENFPTNLKPSPNQTRPGHQVWMISGRSLYCRGPRNPPLPQTADNITLNSPVHENKLATVGANTGPWETLRYTLLYVGNVWPSCRTSITNVLGVSWKPIADRGSLLGRRRPLSGDAEIADWRECQGSPGIRLNEREVQHIVHDGRRT